MLARFLNSKSLRDKIPTKELLKNINMLSVNQLNVKMKIMEVWKLFNVEGYPLNIPTQSATIDSLNTRAMTSFRPIEQYGSHLISNTCISDSIKLWNMAPEDIKSCKSRYQIKKLARYFALTLPV